MLVVFSLVCPSAFSTISRLISGSSVTSSRRYSLSAAPDSRFPPDFVLQSVASDFNEVGLNVTPVLPNTDAMIHAAMSEELQLVRMLVIVIGGALFGTSCEDRSDVGLTSATQSGTTPTISIATPPEGRIVAGSVLVSATASAGVVGVQVKLDGQNLGAEITTSPFSMVWNTTSASNGSHTVTAVAEDAVGSQATAAVTITVDNTLKFPPPATARWFLRSIKPHDSVGVSSVTSSALTVAPGYDPASAGWGQDVRQGRRR